MGRVGRQGIIAQDKESTVRRPELRAVPRGNPQYADSRVLCARLARRWPVVTPVRRWPLGLLALGGAVVGLVATTGLGLNSSPSMPRGIYRVVRADLTRGALVAACLPPDVARWGRERGYLGPGACAEGAQPILKRLGALGGDVIEVGPDRVIVNGTPLPHSATAAHDSRRRSLPHVSWGRHAVAADEIWLFATESPASWDSRYFGALSRSQILAVVRPVLTVP